MMQSVEMFKKQTNYNLNATITQSELNIELGDPKKINVLTQNNMNIDFISHKFEDTQFYRHWIERIEDEHKYIEDNKNKISIGDVKKHYTRIKNICKNIEIMKDRHKEYNGIGNINIELHTLENEDYDRILTLARKYNSDRLLEIDEELLHMDNNTVFDTEDVTTNTEYQ